MWSIRTRRARSQPANGGPATCATCSPRAIAPQPSWVSTRTRTSPPECASLQALLCVWQRRECQNRHDEPARTRLDPGGGRRADDRRGGLPLPRSRRLRDAGGARWAFGARAGGGAAARPRGARPDAARRGGPRGDAPDPRSRPQPDSDHPAHRQGRGDRPRGRPTAGRGRLRGEAVLPGGARGAHRRCAAPRGHVAHAGAAARVRRADDRSRRAPRDGGRRGGAAHAARVRPAAVLLPPSQPGVHSPAADGPGLAVLVLHRHLHGDGAHPPPAREDRARSRGPPLHRDRVGSGLQVPAVMGRGLVLAFAAAAVAAGVAGTVYGHTAGRETLAILAPLGLLTVAPTYALIRNRERLGGLRRQVLVSSAVIVGQLL